MAPILLKKREDNNSHAPSVECSNARTTKVAATATTANRTSVSSRETKERDNNAKVKSTEEPAKRATSSRSSSSSSSSRFSSRSTVGKSKEPEKPEAPEPVSRKVVKTPPTTTSSKTTATPPVAVDKPATKTPAQTLPSQTLHKHKQAPVWTTGKKKHKTNFGAAYDSGSIPCRINHGSIRNAVQWTKEPDTIDFSPLLVTCVEGFQETEHPFVFLARTMFRELMKVEDVREKTLSVLPQVIPPLRVALMASDDDVFLMALEATRIVSDVVEEEMNTYLPKLTQQIHRKLLTKQLRTPVEETLATLERNGGKEALAIIRNKIPTYVSLH